eukprot:1023955-Pleurochrysis_carterae.AAC.1
MFLQPILGFAVEEGKGVSSLTIKDSPETTLLKCQTASYFGGPRVKKGIFQASPTELIVLLWNNKYGLVFKTLDSDNVLAALAPFGKEPLPEEMAPWVAEMLGDDERAEYKKVDNEPAVA